jgi:hypothetical protein
MVLPQISVSAVIVGSIAGQAPGKSANRTSPVPELYLSSNPVYQDHDD